MWFWVDGTANFYNRILFHSDYSLHEDLGAYMSLYHPVRFYMATVSERRTTWIFCERRIPIAQHRPVLPISIQSPRETVTTNRTKLHLTKCPSGHFTHQFLSCDLKSKCVTGEHRWKCEQPLLRGEGKGRTSTKEGITLSVQDLVTVEMFECDKHEETIHYTLVCDFRPDCIDSSDEARCHHRRDGPGFMCSSGQWIADSKVCDMRDDCLDDSDEDMCDIYRTEDTNKYTDLQPPIIIDMDGYRSFTMEALDPAESTCPLTHFRCPGQYVYCLPVYLRCNDIKDCLGGEDEIHCDDAKCPGYYRCRSSSVCLHGSHLCDGWPQCPERDDELLCNTTCPSACRCQGLAFVCSQPFNASLYADLRYLDGSGSGIDPEDVTDNFYLIYLNLASCGLKIWPEIEFRNLQRLRLDDNEFQTFQMQHMRLLPSLRFLSLKGNSLRAFFVDNVTVVHRSLLTLDVSGTFTDELDTQFLAAFPFIKLLNLSYSGLNTIRDNGFTDLSQLQVVDLRGCDIKEFPGDLFDGLEELSFVYADNYKLCCRATLPTGFNIDSCFAPKDEISSCEDLLRSNLYRTFLWSIGMMSVLGNVGSLTYKLVFQRSEMFTSGYNVFVMSLCLSDLLMGTYLVLIGVADQIYSGIYLWNDMTWKKSVLCSIAGYFSLVSNEVSAFMICLITLDRFIVLRFPFTTLRFEGKSALLASLLTWTVGIFLAAAPLLPNLSHWNFYSQSGICIPLPVTRHDFQGKSYSFAVMIVFNFILFLMIAFGQVFIYWSIRSNAMAVSDTNRQSQNLTIAQRLLTVVVSDFLCWFPIGVLGLTASSGTPVPGEVNVAMAIFVLPLNSALNPFLYTYNMLMEKYQIRKEVKLLERLRHSLAKQSAR